MMKLPPLYSVSEILRLYGLTATKKLSQNFILDMNLNDKIVGRLGDVSGQTIIEIGSGPGGLTRSLLNAGADRVIAVELDTRFIPVLQDLREASRGRLDIVHSDILKWDIKSALTHLNLEKQAWHEKPKIRLIGNLPFAITAPLLKRFMYAIADRKDFWEYCRADMNFVFQREVADSICCYHGADRSRISLLTQRLCDNKLVIKLPSKVFVPAPDVEAAVVQLIPKDIPPPELSMDDFVKVTTALFSERRKMVRASFSKLIPKHEVMSLLERVNLEQTIRPEHMTLEEFENLATEYHRIKDSVPDMDYRREIPMSREERSEYVKNIRESGKPIDFADPTKVSQKEKAKARSKMKARGLPKKQQPKNDKVKMTKPKSKTLVEKFDLAFDTIPKTNSSEIEHSKKEI